MNIYIHVKPNRKENEKGKKKKKTKKRPRNSSLQKHNLFFHILRN